MCRLQEIRQSIWVFFLLSACCFLPPVSRAEAWEIARPDYAWSFPEDHWARLDYKTEWWYFTGHLTGEDGRRFGYQFTFFRVGLLREKPMLDSEWAMRDLIMGHAVISDLDRNDHHFSEVLYRATPLLGGFGVYPDTLLAWSCGPAGTEVKWTLRWNGSAFGFKMADRKQGMAFDLRTQPKKALIFQGPNGYSRKGEGAGAASQYYSFTRLGTAGTVTVNGETVSVTGESWMDKEFGSNQLGDHQVGWDWFSLQLSDGREVMLYHLRDQAGRIDHARGTLIAVDGATRYLTQDEFDVTVTKTWSSAETDATYPAGWVLHVNGERLTLDPEMADQENRGSLAGALFYWEGAVRVTDAAGKQIGQGYVELTGYGTGSRPGI